LQSTEVMDQYDYAELAQIAVIDINGNYLHVFDNVLFTIDFDAYPDIFLSNNGDKIFVDFGSIYQLEDGINLFDNPDAIITEDMVTEYQCPVVIYIE
jgi:hypothetical protein